MNTLVFNFDNDIYNLSGKSKKEQYPLFAKMEINSKFQKDALQKAKQLGYKTILYTNSDIFVGDADEIIKVNKKEYNYGGFWDSFKFIVLDERKDDYLLCDPDIIFHDKIKINYNADVIFDAWETFGWNGIYKNDIKTLTDLGVQKVIPEWTNKQQHIMNCGILKFNNQYFKNLYVDRWKKLYEFCFDNENKLDINKCTPIAAQYLLTILCNHYKFSKYNYSEQLRKQNDFYTHFAGDAKFQAFKANLTKKVII